MFPTWFDHEDERIKNRVTPKIYYKYFFKKSKEINLSVVRFPKVNRVFS